MRSNQEFHYIPLPSKIIIVWYFIGYLIQIQKTNKGYHRMTKYRNGSYLNSFFYLFCNKVSRSIYTFR